MSEKQVSPKRLPIRRTLLSYRRASVKPTLGHVFKRGFKLISIGDVIYG